ncbi:uncharacterized protein LOC124909687 [Impatiens glandulifera]|uniref:uncharacterized protein LOC124909687 n=1 Tax=Impatiens glandulifera TaxID=253017 RepID=UPI001FB0D977|nr:uncharacterized protein LOC124909687 [Impatiens glandulifera]
MIEEKHTCPRILLFIASRSNTNTSQEVSNALFKCNVFNKIHESEEEKTNYCGDEFEEMGDYIYDDLFEVDGRKRKNEDGTPKQTLKRRKPIKRTTIKRTEKSFSDESSEDNSRSTTRESSHVPSATNPQKKEDSSPTRQDKFDDKFDNPVTKAQNDDKFDELTKDVKELTRDVKELKTEMKVVKEDQRVMFNHIIQLLGEIKQQKNDVAADDDLVEKDLEINKDVADENDDNDVADGLEMINNDDVGLEDAAVDGLEMINNAAVVDDDKDSAVINKEAVVDVDQNKDASAVDGLEMNKEAVVDDDQNKDAAAVDDYDSELLDELKQWLKLEDEDKINLVLFHAGRELFNRMLRPQNWLHDHQVKEK